MILRNVSREAIFYVYMSPSSDTSWGQDLLGSNTLAIGQSLTLSNITAGVWDIRVVDDAARDVPALTTGALVVKLPLPPGALPTLWNADERFRTAYLADYPGFYKTADAGYVDEDGYVYVMARTDDIINVAGHRLSTGQMEEVLSRHPAVAECAVIGVADELKGELPLGLLVLKAGITLAHAEVIKQVVAAVRAVWKETLIISLVIILGALTSWSLVAHNPEWYYNFVDESMAGGRDPRATVEFLRSTLGHGKEGGGQESGLHVFATFLFTHNSRVSIMSFALGFAFGVPASAWASPAAP